MPHLQPSFPPSDPLLAVLAQAQRMPEHECVTALLGHLETFDVHHRAAVEQAKKLVEKVRAKRLTQGGVDAFMIQYDLSSAEGIALMCLAEALLRIPDPATADKLIQDKISMGDWHRHVGKSESLFVNAATWGLVLTGKMVDTAPSEAHYRSILTRFFTTRSQPVIRQAIRQAMKILGNQFVLGETIQNAMSRARGPEATGYRFSYDMLGEAARTEADAQHYLKAYSDAIHALGMNQSHCDPITSAGISIKLSALHPRYELAQIDRCFAELYPRLQQLAILAKQYNIGLTIDAEEADRLELSLYLLEKLASDPALKGWNGLGLAVQAYQKRAFYVLDWLKALAQKTQRRLMVRLVKGAYWDSEIKWSQVSGVNDYPVFTRKVHTDVSYLACAQKLLANTAYFYPQFATHNAYTLSAILSLAGDYRDFEFQCLHGMGATLYDEVVGCDKLGVPCRVYAPVGPHKHLLAYLVRRLLENGANSSFVNRIADANLPIMELLHNPVQQALAGNALPNRHIPTPPNLYGASRMNAKAIDLNNRVAVEALLQSLERAAQESWQAAPLVAHAIDVNSHPARAVKNPATGAVIGQVREAVAADVRLAMASAKAAFVSWSKTSAEERASLLSKAADLLEANQERLMYLAIAEAGKSIANAQGEVREAVDFCRYYAEQARIHLAQPVALPGPTGESNRLEMSGRGVMVCISPWNFPLAIFLGEVTAALAAGNTVIAKPAEQTPLIAAEAVRLLHQAGIPQAVVQLLPGSGEVVGACLVEHPDIAGVIFTGSTEVAQGIQQTLARKKGPIVPLIAETGGQNCMIVDSSALAEQVVADVLTSGFDSAGQRCSALRVLFVQNEIADTVLTMLKGAMAELKVGDPSLLSTDIGPVIDSAAQQQLLLHIATLQKQGFPIYSLTLPKTTAAGTFVPPTVIEIPNIEVLKREVFGPVVHVVRFASADLDKVIDAINSTGYGLTFGIHSRINQTVQYVTERINAGNIYVNRNMVGAVVGVQPFGGQGLSGTGPKAGGPLYLLRLVNERTVTINTTAAGGNASLMSIQE